MAKKQGDLRVLKGEAIYGPMSKSDLDQLLAEGRIGRDDQVSVREGPWLLVSDYLANPSAWEDTPLPASSPAAGREGGGREGPLRVLKGDRIFGSLDRQQIAELIDAGRFTGDDLVCALHGPWMKLADFFAPPPRVAPPVALDDDVSPYDPFTPTIFEVAELVDPGIAVFASESGLRPRSVVHTPQLSDEWYVKVRGIHSAPLQKHHLRSLLAANEITPDCPVRHPSWRSENWWPIRSVPELADLVGRSPGL
ncbi:MAG: DUF4339 domain-containing protein [Pirellulales bacterium]